MRRLPMLLWKRFRSRISGRADRELDRELGAHLDLETEAQQESGLPTREARDAARRALGNTTAVKEDVRAAWGWASLERLAQDLRYAIRILRKTPGFTVVAIASLALGIGLNASVFSILNALFIRPLPAPEPDRLVRIYQHERGNTSYRNFRDLEARSETVQSLAVFSWPNEVAMTIPQANGPGRTEKIWGAAVSASYFELLGIQAELGRTFLADEDTAPGKSPVILISDSLWRASFQAAPQIVGMTVRINGNPFQIVGVAPPNVAQPETLSEYQFWVPVSMCGQVGIGDRLESRRQTWLRMIGRLKPGIALGELRAELSVIANQITTSDPQNAHDLSFAPYPEPEGRLQGIPGLREFGWILQAIVLLVLVIACANIANLQLARSLARSKEIAVRMAIGAGRGRILRQFVTESVLLTVLGGTLGLVAAFWGARLLLLLAPPMPAGLPIAIDAVPDGRVLTYGFAATLVVGALFGVVTALSAQRFGLNPLLKSGDLSIHPGRRWLAPRKLLVAGQVGLSVVLMVAAGLFVESLGNARRLDLGFQPEHRLTVAVNPDMVGYRPEQRVTLYAEAMRRLSGLPGVISASSTWVLPLSGGYLGDGYIWPEGDMQPGDAGRPMVYFDHVGPGYFTTMGSTLLAGREFTERDSEDSPPVAVVNETFARTFWPGEDAIGKRFRVGRVDNPVNEIVGIVRDGRYNSLGEPTQRHVYQPFHPDSKGVIFVLHTGVDPQSLAGAARASLREIDAGLPVSVTTLAEHLGLAFWGARIAAALLGSFAFLGLLLSALGLYGTLVFVVNRGIREIGIRIALGASPRGVQRLFIRRGLVMALSGAIPGLLAALAGARLLTAYLCGVNPLSPNTLASVVVLFLVVAFVASYLPSKKAVRIEPLTALRQD
jgi:predicted permease